MDAVDKLLNKIERNPATPCSETATACKAILNSAFSGVKPIEDVYQECFVDFSTGVSNPFVTIGISEDKNGLWRMKTEMIDNREEAFISNIIVDDSLRVVG
jgi:hypothetical protein